MLIPRSAWRKVYSADVLSVLSFNTLRRNYHFRENDWASEQCKSWEHRKGLLEALLVDELAGTSILCLQEAELRTIDEDFSFLAKDYDRVSAGKDNDGGHHFTKPSTFYRRDQFELIWHMARTRVVLAELQWRHTGLHVFVINVHLSGGNDKDTERANQVKSAWKYLEKRRKNGEPVLLCGDFNCSTDGSDEHDVRKFIKEKDMNPVFSKRDIPCTHKWGAHKGNMFFNFIDQVYASSDMRLVAKRNPFEDETWSALFQSESSLGLPNEAHPSDHIPLVGAFKMD